MDFPGQLGGTHVSEAPVSGIARRGFGLIRVMSLVRGERLEKYVFVHKESRNWFLITASL